MNACSNNANTLLRDINEAYLWFQKYYAVTYGLTQAQILALPGFSGRTAQDITNIAAAFQVFRDLYNLMNNVSAPAQANRVGYPAPFTS
ncbi:MAG: hypothetical protein WAN11_06275 [Syntrophobacteraceae bacterium]